MVSPFIHAMETPTRFPVGINNKTYKNYWFNEWCLC